MLKTTVVDQATGKKLKINEEGVIGVVVHPHPPLTESKMAIPFRQYFTDDGLAAGTNDMQVNGSATAVEYWIPADNDEDIYIKLISVLIEDGSGSLNEFGNTAALTNGVLFQWVSQDRGVVTIHDALKTNWDFVRLSGGQPAFGAQANAFRANNVDGGAEGYTPMIDLAYTFGMPFGIKLRKGTNDKLVFTVRDNTTGVDGFNIIGYGIKF